EVADLAVVGVPDRAFTGLDGRDDTGGALGGLATLDRPGLRRRVGPRARRCLAQVVGEVLGGARVVRAVHRGDVGAGQLGIRVVGLDRGVVPLGDLAGEDLGSGVRGELEV